MTLGKDSKALVDIDIELKEAVCDALVNLISSRASGSDEEGRVVYGWTPRRGIVSGQLLPRFSDANEDETSDIRIAAIGFDFQIQSRATSLIRARPRFSVYLRVLPSWEELSDKRHGIEIDFKLDKKTKKEIDEKIRTRRKERFIRQGIDQVDWRALGHEKSAEVRDQRQRIQDDLRIEVYAEYNILLNAADVTSFKPEAPEPEEPAEQVAESPDGEQATEAPAPAIGRLVREGRAIPYHLIRPAPIPGKWIRLDLTLPEMTWTADLAGEDLARRFEAYSIEMRTAVAQQIDAWRTSAGVENAWRDQKVRPEDATSEDSWNKFLARVRELPVEANVIPDFGGLALRADRQVDFLDPTKTSIRVTLDNGCLELSPKNAGKRCNAIFGTSLSMEISAAEHVPLLLDRVEPSYRFRDFLQYPAIGVNCGIESDEKDGVRRISTTWAPRFTQPRVVPRNIKVETRFRQLADGHDIGRLLDLPREYREWVQDSEAELRDKVIDGLDPDDADIERNRFAADIAGQRLEAAHIEAGVRLLMESREASLALEAGRSDDGLARKAAPWSAWLLTNEAFARRDAKFADRGWRLFQMAFVLSHVPTFSSRMSEYERYFDAERDELTASLLYFPTGGGKSEAFYGALLFAIFLDRLRGKDRGVTAMIRYPLRLLTLQQAQRLLRLIAVAELVRVEKKVGAWPIEIGFWVGSSNTPNRYDDIKSGLPKFGDPGRLDDRVLDGSTFVDGNIKEEALRYQQAVAAYNKVPNCPCCGKHTGLRRYEPTDKMAARAVIVCFDAACPWNDAHRQITPLPFLLTDDTIYQRAPAIVLGTVDKLAMLGQHPRTITNILGMFGAARWISPSGHLTSPSDKALLDGGADASGASGVFPAYRNGRHVFYDPFPSLVIQDEAHLLEESLGTFSGLFDTLLERTFSEIAALSGEDLQIAEFSASGGNSPRLPKMIAATATISDPDRQLKTLYQRRPMRYPYPGPDIYRSFFAEPEGPPSRNADRVALAASLPSYLAPETTSPWSRLYVSLMTNDATHTVTTVGVLSSFHAIISRLWNGLLDPSRSQSMVGEIRGALSAGEGGGWRRDAIDRAVAEGRVSEIMALVDLHRIALAYVTNKKGGDQILDALHTGVAQSHRKAGLAHDRFDSRLISGGVDMQGIQSIMKDAELSFAGKPYPPVGETLRSIVATSAISHGVDVDRFNSMFFAGLPSDIAEYIQASSRVGRTHVGFVMLLPTPQSRRDRYVIETHDVFHRFLERMIAAPAVERWAENAIRRVLASYVQTWAMLNDMREFKQASDNRKSAFKSYDSTHSLRQLANRDPSAFSKEVAGFMLAAMGLEGRDGLGRPPYPEFYEKMVLREADRFGESMRASGITADLRQYWADFNPAFKKPMTSLRDVDEAGVITASAAYPGGVGQTQWIKTSHMVKVMKTVRGQRGAADGDVERDEGAI
ncbi:DEAD/DEAH box helicase family protein [Rhizobium leguminosarum]|uniref:DEAD/DEAH box helicase family protein n=1 Tax=Rhizobium leguminosarum TaxID=384 RepID=UPI0010307E65|nr:DEAD/DEAH box helicase family protein [Rhizobium leguminosarum]TAV81579.1 helicase [Rhizobium leguminosarum]TAV94185.1 helicase [Rhizobium leguminosarum]TAW35260.1 helicase [Rhizobium leguminosarum]